MTFDFIVVATTRPETMLGDTAVAVHPDDERYKTLVGKNAILPLVGRKIPIVADEYSDPEKGTGAVKITPAHDFNDFEVGKRHKLPLVNVLTVEAKMTLKDNEDFLRGVPPSAELDETLSLDGLDRSVARKKIVERMEAAGLIDKIEPNTHMVPHGDRSTVVIEPYLTDQWYVDAKTLAQPALEAVRSGKTAFVPKNWEKTYYDWMENIQPWCVSRQLWWGHQIPAWYGPDGQYFVAETEAEAAAEAKKAYGKDTPLTRDEDVLDTWFSSALWPFSTLGWPENTPEVKRYYPTDVLVTGFDIIFFWVARMMMMGLHFMKKEPFHTVYIHASRPRREGRQDVEVEGQRHRPARPHRRLRRRCAALHARARWRRKATTSSSRRSMSRTIAISRPSSGTPRALSSSTAPRGSRASIRNPRRKRSTAGSRTRPRKRAARSPKRSRATGSTTPPARPIASSGTSIATGMSSSRSRC